MDDYDDHSLLLGITRFYFIDILCVEQRKMHNRH